ncbi:hypothetical protein CIHG_04379 [Coccidioides immitis H538.4]|uniref:PPM-type phosphatase domain-containing protein n=1 Tax=Coccidioides immitis H538.4 TaxID=396776 RepID=A0A0J8RPP3_COCIT|nr:hypothetical protein CIHG_04379 [Coccidioides immitis H538.4]
MPRFSEGQNVRYKPVGEHSPLILSVTTQPTRRAGRNIAASEADPRYQASYTYVDGILALIIYIFVFGADGILVDGLTDRAAENGGLCGSGLGLEYDCLFSYIAPKPSPMQALSLLDCGIATDQGQRPHQEDRYAFITPQGFPACDHRQLAFFAVYDGHGGPDVSDHASKHLHLNLISSPAFQAGDCENAIRGAIDAEENQLFEGFASGGNDASTSGSTVALTLVDLNKGEVVIANLGDSHIVLGELEWTGGKITYKTKRLTTADNPDVPEEKSRVEAAGGTIRRRAGQARIGTINMSRALGDLQYKKPLNDEDATGDFISSQTPHMSPQT